MALSDNVATVEQKLNQTWEQGRERVLSLVDDVKERADGSTGPTTDLLRSQAKERFEVTRDRLRDDMDRNQRFAVELVKNLSGRLPSYQMPIDVESLAGSGFDMAQQALDRNRQFTLELIKAALPAAAAPEQAKKAKKADKADKAA